MVQLKLDQPYILVAMTLWHEVIITFVNKSEQYHDHALFAFKFSPEFFDLLGR